jgi:OFA family oxalate/formate antiporter-like MFS transporter
MHACRKTGFPHAYSKENGSAMTDTASAPSSSPARYLVLLGAIVVQLILGTVYGYSIFWQPLEAEVGLAPTQATYAFSICILSFAVTMVIAGRVQDIKGPRFPAVVGAVLMGAGFLLAGLMDNPFVFYLAHAAFAGAVAIVLLMLYHALFGRLDTDEIPILKYVPAGILVAVVTAGVILGNQYVGKLEDGMDKLFLLWGTVGFLAGAGIGFAYVCPIAALVKWFPQHKGLVSGIAVAGFGFGAYLFKGKTIGALGFIEAHGITNFFLIHALVCFVVVTIGAMMLRNPPSVATPVTPSGDAPKNDEDDSTWQDTLKRPAFYVLWLMFFSGAMAGLMVIGILKPFAGGQLLGAASEADPAGWIASAIGSARQAMGEAFAEWRAGFDTDEAAATKWIMLKGAEAVGYLAIFNAVGRIVWGLLSDRIGRTSAFVAMFVFQAVMLFLLGALKTELTLAVGASIIGFNFGGNFALFPSATADLFGAKNLGANYGWVFTSYGVAGVVGIAAWNAAKEHASPTTAFTIAAALCLVSAGLAVGLAMARKKQAA